VKEKGALRKKFKKVGSEAQRLSFTGPAGGKAKAAVIHCGLAITKYL
jgi:hypothetical protein